MTPTRIDILRHGDTPLTGRFCGRSDPALTEKGWQDLVRQTKNRHWDAVVSSPAQRCRAFAESLCLPLTIDQRLQEMDFGAWEGMSAEEIWEQDQTRLSAFWEDPSATPAPGGEPWATLCSRAAEAFEEIVLARQGKKILLLTHAGVMRSLLVTQLGLSFTASWKVALPTAAMMQLAATIDVEEKAFHVSLTALGTTQ